jgi:TPR repeat protein
MHNKDGNKPPEPEKRSTITAPERTDHLPPTTKVKQRQKRSQETLNTRDSKMARYEMNNMEAAMGGETQADVFCEMGLMYATGRGCDLNLVAAHKWLNIAAIKGSERAALLRADLGRTMTKTELAQALRSAREWMTMH